MSRLLILLFWIVIPGATIWLLAAYSVKFLRGLTSKNEEEDDNG